MEQLGGGKYCSHFKDGKQRQVGVGWAQCCNTWVLLLATIAGNPLYARFLKSPQQMSVHDSWIRIEIKVSWLKSRSSQK